MSADEDAATIQQVMLEGASGVGFIARAPANLAYTCPDAPKDPSSHGTSLPYALAAFLIAKTSPYSYFGISSGWYDVSWCWHSLYDEAAKCGPALAAPIRTGSHSWTRNFQHCLVTVNTTSRVGVI